MIRIQQLKLPIKHTKEALEKKLSKSLRVLPSQIEAYQIVKQSIDARKKSEICYVYTIDVKIAQEQRIVKMVNHNNIMLAKENAYILPEMGAKHLANPPVIIGNGPAGLFCAYILAVQGYRPIIIERGKKVTEREKDVALFWEKNILKPDSNVQFGEGGAGTFSDGKLNTLIKDVNGRSKKVLDTFQAFGAPGTIGYQNKPHIGTDVLIEIICNMREKIITLGGSFLFETCVTDFIWEGEHLAGVVCQQGTNKSLLEQKTQLAVLAIGHSARDTFSMLDSQGFAMEAKAFATGLRVEHPQQQINESQYGKQETDFLPPADYKLATKLTNGRGVYSFCMCPGGYVVNASSQPGRLAVNGMSYSQRDGGCANSAIIVTVTPADFKEPGPLGGVAFQQQLEQAAYDIGKGAIPQQLLGDFEAEKESLSFGSFKSETKGKRVFAPLHQLLPPELGESFLAGMHHFSRYIPGFDRYDCILSGVESRTSSPVRILRNQQFESNKMGVYPCGEGAGYAGGIMSAAIDGIKTAEEIIKKYHN